MPVIAGLPLIIAYLLLYLPSQHIAIQCCSIIECVSKCSTWNFFSPLFVVVSDLKQRLIWKLSSKPTFMELEINNSRLESSSSKQEQNGALYPRSVRQNRGSISLLVRVMSIHHHVSELTTMELQLNFQAIWWVSLQEASSLPKKAKITPINYTPWRCATHWYWK